MLQRLSLVGVAIALGLSGWGGVLAAALTCPHVRQGARAADAVPACCRLQTDAGEQHCAVKMKEQPGHAHSTEAAGAPVAHDAASHTRAPQGRTRRAAHAAGEAGRPADDCLHCVVRSGTTPPRASVREPEGARRDLISRPAQARGLVVSNAEPFRREVIPSQGAPPGPPSQRRHVLVSVFLI